MNAYSWFKNKNIIFFKLIYDSKLTKNTKPVKLCVRNLIYPKTTKNCKYLRADRLYNYNKINWFGINTLNYDFIKQKYTNMSI